ncbi:hypothetical protein CHUAL_008145 [Chamberlinius hualienensis]
MLEIILYGVIFGAFLLLFTTNRVFKFNCKLILYYALILFASLITIPFTLFRPGNVENTLIAGFFFRMFCSIFGIRWEIKGVENIDKNNPCVVLCNHQSSIDVMGMMEMWPYLARCCPMIKRELKYLSGPFGILAAMSGSIFIDRFNPEKARDTANNTVNYLKEKNIKLWVFPEGTRNAKNTMLPFKKGAFHIAIQGKLPILPLVFSSYSELYDKKKKIFKSGTVTVTVLPPIDTTKLVVEDVNRLADETRELMLKTFYKTSNLSPPPKDEIKNGSAH